MARNNRKHISNFKRVKPKGVNLFLLAQRLSYALENQTDESLTAWLKNQREAKPLPEEEALILNKAFNKAFSNTPTRL